MKKLILCALGLALCLTGCGRSEIPALSEVGALYSESGYSDAQLLESLSGLDREEIVDAWGEPDGMLSGLCGDIWHTGEELIVVLYCDRDSKVIDVIVGKPDV